MEALNEMFNADHNPDMSLEDRDSLSQSWALLRVSIEMANGAVKGFVALTGLMQLAQLMKDINSGELPTETD